MRALSKKTKSVLRTTALTVAFLLAMVLWNHIELPFLPHGIFSFVYALQVVVAALIGLCWLGMLLWSLALAIVRFPMPFVAATVLWFCIYYLYSRTLYSDQIPIVILGGMFFVLLVCGLAWYVETRTASQIRDSRYSPKDAHGVLNAFWMSFKRALPGLLILGCLCMVVAAAPAVWFIRRLNADTNSKKQHVNPPTTVEGSVEEVGYVYLEDSKIKFKQHRQDVSWQIKIPSTGKIYFCTWIDGSPEFKRDDDVKLIHRSPDADFSDYSDYSGYIVGLDGGRKGKYAGVQAHSEDELDSPQD